MTNAMVVGPFVLPYSLLRSFAAGQLPAAKKALRAALLTGTVLWAVGAAVLSVRPHTGQELPALSFKSFDGQPVTLAEFKGKPIVVNLWATWCPPCAHEMPMLHRAQIDRPGVNFVS